MRHGSTHTLVPVPSRSSKVLEPARLDLPEPPIDPQVVHALASGGALVNERTARVRSIRLAVWILRFLTWQIALHVELSASTHHFSPCDYEAYHDRGRLHFTPELLRSLRGRVEKEVDALA